MGLDVDDVQLSARRGVLRILGKGRDGGKLREVPIHVELRGRTVITRLGENLANDDFGPHTLRHTFATQLVRSGVDPVLVAELFGHSRTDTTQLYSLPTDADRAAALDKLLVDR